jgi:hypothetical protein
MGVSSAKSRPARSDRSVERRRPVLLGSPTSVWNLRSHTEAPRGRAVVPDESSRPPTNRPPPVLVFPYPGRYRPVASSDHGRSASLARTAGWCARSVGASSTRGRGTDAPTCRFYETHRRCPRWALEVVRPGLGDEAWTVRLDLAAEHVCDGAADCVRDRHRRPADVSLHLARAARSAKPTISRGIPRTRSSTDSSASTNQSTSDSSRTSGGRSLITFMLCPATWLRIR